MLFDSMAAPEEKQGQNGVRKLLLHDRVEVRSSEQLLRGSWHKAQVIGFGNNVRRVSYEELGVIENIPVSSGLDGIVSANSEPYVRGKIRPFPPRIEMQTDSIHCGLCVDVPGLYIDVRAKDAWWEGVVFDQKEGSDQRTVFFPDMGIQQTVNIDAMRITQEWDETTAEWKIRGDWTFLEMLAEVQKIWPVAASPSQAWFDIQMKLGSVMAVDWTHPSREFWKSALRNALKSSFDLLMKQTVEELRFQGGYESCMKKNKNLPGSGFRFAPEDEDEDEDVSISASSDDDKDTSAAAIVDDLQSAPDLARSISEEGEGEGERERERHDWQLARELVPEFSPGSIHEYLTSRRENEKARNHFAALNWRVETTVYGGVKKWRYISPDGHAHYSLKQACQVLQFIHPETREKPVAPVAGPLAMVKHSSSTPRPRVSTYIDADGVEVAQFEKEYCPSAIQEYVQLNASFHSGQLKGHGLIHKAKKHLSAVGWSFYYKVKAYNRQRELRYVPPCGKKRFISLKSACEWYLENEQNRASPSSNPPLLLFGPPIEQEQKQGPLGLRNDSEKEDEQPARIRRSQVQGRKTRNVLLNLIEAEIVVSGDMVRYRTKAGVYLEKDGRISRDGIVCTCCSRVFGLSKFEKHAGSNYHRPSAHLILENGRSLADCLLQLKTGDRRADDAENEEDVELEDGDYICSVCHKEGNLILCDLCPSAFHTRCVGLKNVPEGTWFCPPCCCRICNLVAIKDHEEEPSDESYLRCGQCDHRYHVKCSRSNGLIRPDHQPGTSWFCSLTCEQIHSGLQDLLGKPVSVGSDDLTLTLLKHKPGCANESKLNAALATMRKCFKPVKDARSGRDIVQDAIFNEWSNLHRLNFLGFYTLVLEQKDEIITVALVRIHGKKVAEMPFIATRHEYHKKGMCRIVMNELEKALMELGVERLILPAVHEVMKMWKNSFGFSEMHESEKANFLGYTFLDFQHSTMCQKLLQKSPPPPHEYTNEVEVSPEENAGTETKADEMMHLEKQAAPEHMDNQMFAYEKAMKEFENPEMTKEADVKHYKRRKFENANQSENTSDGV